MGLKVEQECDWCGLRESVELKVVSGKIDLNVGLPNGWSKKPAFPGGNVGPQEGQELCAECAERYDPTIKQAEEARDNTFLQVMQSAKARRASTGHKTGKSSVLAKV